MDWVYFGLFIVALIVAIIFIVKLDTRTKNKYKTKAYELLEISDPDSKEVKDTCKGLRLYGGRIKKDKETRELIKRLLEKHGRLLD